MNPMLLRRGSWVGENVPQAFPEVRGTSVAASSGSTASLTLNYTAQSGDMVIINYGSRSAVDAEPGLSEAGWTLLASNANGSNAASWVYKKIVSGSGSLTFTPLSSRHMAAHAFVIKSGTYHGDVEIANSSGTGAPNPASLTPSWGTAKTLWIAGYHQAYGSTVTSYPLPSNNISIRTGTGSTFFSTAACADSVLVGTLDPSSYSVTNTAAYYGRHIAVRPL